MARKVFVSSDMSNDERLIEIAEQNPIAALIWPWLLTAFDDWGRAQANPKRLKAMIFPMIDIITADTIKEALQLYQNAGLLVLYEADGHTYMAIPEDKWYKYQTHMNRKNRRPGKDKMQSDFPAPPGLPSTPHGDTRGNVGDDGDTWGPIPSPSPSPTPSLNKSTTTTNAREDLGVEDEPQTIDEAFRRVFGVNIVPPIFTSFLAKIVPKFGERYAIELLLEAGETAQGKPNLRYLEGIHDGWVKRGIRSRAEARAERDDKKRDPPTRRQKSQLSVLDQLEKEFEAYDTG